MVESISEQTVAIARNVAIVKMQTTKSIWIPKSKHIFKTCQTFRMYISMANIFKMLSGHNFIIVATLMITLIDWSIIGLNTQNMFIVLHGN